jgi:hypothetical protein
MLDLNNKKIIVENKEIIVNRITGIKINSKGILKSFIINNDTAYVNVLPEYLNENSENQYADFLIKNLSDKLFQSSAINRVIIFVVDNSVILVKCMTEKYFLIEQEEINKGESYLKQKYLPETANCLRQCKIVVGFVGKNQYSENEFLIAEEFVKNNQHKISSYINKEVLECTNSYIRQYHQPAAKIKRKI